MFISNFDKKGELQNCGHTGNELKMCSNGWIFWSSICLNNLENCRNYHCNLYSLHFLTTSIHSNSVAIKLFFWQLLSVYHYISLLMLQPQDKVKALLFLLHLAVLCSLIEFKLKMCYQSVQLIERWVVSCKGTARKISAIHRHYHHGHGWQRNYLLLVASLF